MARRKSRSTKAKEEEKVAMPTPKEMVEKVNAVLGPVDTPDEKTSLEKIYGKQGPPSDDIITATVIPFVNPVVVQSPARSTMTKHRVIVKKDTVLAYRELYCDVHIVGDKREEVAFSEMFGRSRCKRALSPAEADLVVFTGGPDVDPALYGEERHKYTKPDHDRDTADILMYHYCWERGIPMFGVCRGAQFLHVMNGGKLYQDVDGHYGDHGIHLIGKPITGTSTKYIEKTSSVHHQLVIPDAKLGIEIIATTAKSRSRWKNPTIEDKGVNADCEAFFYPETLCLGVQGHPEYKGYPFYTNFCLDLINHYFFENLDTEWRGSKRRMKADILEQRDGKMPSAAIAAISEGA